MTDMRVFLPFLVASLAACGPKVDVEVAANPAVALPDDAVSVVARDRSCQPLADALVEELWEAGVAVDPRAGLRVEVALCGSDLQFDVEQSVSSDAPDAIVRRTRATARAHGLIVVSDHGDVRAHLIGVGRHQSARSSEGDRGLGTIGRSAKGLAIHDAAEDLSEQLSPHATSVARRVWPNAPETSHKGLFTRAVWAEQRGDLGEALLYALEAYEVRPTARNARYLADLERRESWWARAAFDAQ